MKIATESFITDLIERTRQHIHQTVQLKQLPFKELNWKCNAETWSVLECIEHLNLYGDFYLPEMERKINKQIGKPVEYFKSGLLGNYFANSILPTDKPNKMKAMKGYNPAGSKLELSTLDRFIAQQHKVLELLEKARQVNLTRTKTAISLSKWIKLRLGDTLRFVVYHNQRHLVQANKVISEYQKLTSELKQSTLC